MELPRKTKIDGIEIPYISPSQINMLLTCQKKYEFKYVLNIPDEGDQRDLVFGTSLHAAMEWASHSEKSGEQVRPEQVLVMSQEFFRKEMEAKKIPFTDEDEEEIGTVSKFLWKQMTDKKIKPLLIEEQVIYKFQEENPWAVMGYLDLLGLQNNIPVLIDFKTTKRSPPNGKEASRSHTFQLLLYVAALKAAGIDVQKAYIAYAVRKKYPEIIWAEVRITDNALKWALALAKSVKRIVDVGEFTPNPMSLLCSPKWCSYWNRCEGALQS